MSDLNPSAHADAGFQRDPTSRRKPGRLDKSQLPPSVKYSYLVILPRLHDVTRLIVASFHRQELHSGAELTLNELQQMYWIPKARSLV